MAWYNYAILNFDGFDNTKGGKMSKQNQLGRTFLYYRLSRDDEKAGESMSIENQRNILQKYVIDNGGTIVEEYIDDGWSGTDFNRPGIKKLLSDAQAGKADTIVVKDLSRFGRNYIQVGQYIDYIFPAYGIRFIAISDNIDTAERGSTSMDMMPIMNVFNEWHAANTSKKIRAVLSANWRSGKYTSSCYPYGYKADNDEMRTAVIDEEAAKIVRRIFDLRLQGKSINTIARTLTDEGIPNPTKYYTRLDGKKSNRRSSPYWAPRTISKILKNRTYIGELVQHKTTKISYKNHKIVPVPKDEQILKQNAHEAIIPLDIWNKVQEINQAVSRGKVNNQNITYPLSGFLVCADCGKKFQFKSTGSTRNHLSDSYCCRTYATLGKKYCSSHTILKRQIESIVLQDIHSMLGNIMIDEEKAKEYFRREKVKQTADCRYSDEKQLKAFQQRFSEMDKLIQSAFEEKVLGKLPESVCISLCEKYQAEKISLKEKISELEQRLAESDEEDKQAEEYIARLKKYGKCETLTREMCLQLIKFITIGERPAIGEQREIHIYYKFIDKETLENFQKSKIKQ